MRDFACDTATSGLCAHSALLRKEGIIMLENLLVAFFVLAAVGAGIGCWWYERFGSEKEEKGEDGK